MRARMIPLVVGLLVLAAAPATALQGKPKLGPDAVPITTRTDHLRTAPAPDYWKLSAFYVPQLTTSACSVASVAMAVNFARGLPAAAEAPLVTQTALLEEVGDEAWAEKGAEGGDGVTFAEFVTVVEASLRSYGVEGYAIEVIRPDDDSPSSLAEVRQALAANETSEQDLILVYFNQGVLTGDWDGPHISPIGAYDQGARQVLIMDVDREWYVPYWSPDEKLLDALLKPAPAEHGPLAGETGGLVWIKPAAAP
ncbi:MAG TPA: phytochelatin synthase family protein [Geminicoccaceae bacterium]|nr:phytochelatin synthase family protein [Geminicoccaceae bacterium]